MHARSLSNESLAKIFEMFGYKVYRPAKGVWEVEIVSADDAKRIENAFKISGLPYRYDGRSQTYEFGQDARHEWNLGRRLISRSESDSKQV